MSLDLKYRPRTYDDVLGQKATIRILRRLVAAGEGRHQSYVFAGPYGSGKTTLGRILARALLCEQVTPEGDPCDQCDTCKSMLERGTAVGFTEVDAATNSGKDDVKKVLEQIQYKTFTGTGRVYIFDESHQLSRQALDGLLKPMEDPEADSDNKQLICIFCTTEPEGMRDTVLSRCASAFVIKPVSPSKIAERLAWVCDQEGIEYDEEALVLIARIKESHIRDALKAVEALSKLGKITRESVSEYLHLGSSTLCLDVLEALDHDLPRALEATRQLTEYQSPGITYARLSALAMLAFEVSLGSNKVDPFWDADRVKVLSQKGAWLLGVASRLASRPKKASIHVLLCDLSHLHHVGGSLDAPQVALQVNMVAGGAAPAAVNPPPSQGTNPAPTPTTTAVSTPAVPTAKEVGKVVGIDDDVVNHGAEVVHARGQRRNQLTATVQVHGMDPEQFCGILRSLIGERRGQIGSAGRTNVGSA